MKLRENFITHKMGDVIQLIDISGKFNGIASGNSTTAYILDMLENDVSIDEIIDALHEKYGVSKDILRTDIDEILDKLRSVNALDE